MGFTLSPNKDSFSPLNPSMDFKLSLTYLIHYLLTYLCYEIFSTRLTMYIIWTFLKHEFYNFMKLQKLWLLDLFFVNLHNYFPLLLINLLMCARTEHCYISTRKPSCNIPKKNCFIVFRKLKIQYILNIELVSKISSKERHTFIQTIYLVFILKYMVVWCLKMKVRSMY